MADRNETPLKGKNGIYFRVELGEVTVSNGDTVTLDQFICTSNLSNVYIMKKVDGSEMTQTHADNNVIHITGAGANVPCVYLAYGIKA